MDETNAIMLTLENTDAMTEKINSIQRVKELLRKALVKGYDYDIIPGTSNATLLKPGAEKICILLGVVAKYEIISSQEDFKEGFFAHTIRCVLHFKETPVVEGLGCCNSLEKKFLDKNGVSTDGCSIANTILKSAKKRALIDAVRSIASISELFVAENSEIAALRRKEIIENMTVEDAANYKVTFGKYKGRILSDLYKNAYDGINWFKKNVKDEVLLRAIQILDDAIIQAREKKETKVDEDGVILE